MEIIDKNRTIKIKKEDFLNNSTKTVAYIRVSTTQQDLTNQKLAIHEYARRNGLLIDRFVEVQMSTRKARQKSGVDEVIEGLEPGDALVVSELSRLGRSLGQIIQIVDQLVQRKIQFTAIKESICLNGKQDMRTKVMVTLFGLFAEIERDLISERTKEGLAAAKAKGKLLGRPKGSLGKSRLDGKEEEIRTLIGKKVSKASLAKIMDVSRTTMCHFIETRGLGE